MTSATPTLLYIDDDKTLARLVERGLTRLGFNVAHAASGAAGLERLKQGGIDVIALDQYMPGLDGLETLEQIRAIADAPPVVFVTASQDSQIAVTALKRYGHVDEVAALVAFVAGPESGYITGANLTVDGGTNA